MGNCCEAIYAQGQVMTTEVLERGRETTGMIQGAAVKKCTATMAARAGEATPRVGKATLRDGEAANPIAELAKPIGEAAKTAVSKSADSKTEATSPEIVDVAADFPIEDLFFSTTDSRGVVRNGNNIFFEISGYPREELVGFAHSKVRHPDMPASVFGLFWERLASGKSIAAYVKNRTKDGRYYWVMAMASPIEGGYFSVRLKPTSDLFPVVESAYQRVLAVEKAARQDGRSKAEIVHQGRATLESEIAAMGYACYEDFMIEALTKEVQGRAATLRELPQDSDEGCGASSTRSGPVVSPDQQDAKYSGACDELLSDMLKHLLTLRAGSQKLASDGGRFRKLSRKIAMLALNAKVAADTDILRALSSELAKVEKESIEAVKELEVNLDDGIRRINSLAFEVAVSSLQSEVATDFLGDTPQKERVDGGTELLIAQAARRMQQLFDRLEGAARWFSGTRRLVKRLQRKARMLRFIRMSGVTESSSLERQHPFVGLLEEVQANLRGTLELCSSMDNLLQDCELTLDRIETDKTSLRQLVDKRHQQRDDSKRPCVS